MRLSTMALALALCALCALCALTSCSGPSTPPQWDDWLDKQISPAFEEVLRAQPLLMMGGARIVHLAGHRPYLLAVGITQNKAARDSSARARIETRRVGEIRARHELLRFLEVQVSGETTVETTQQSVAVGDVEATREVETIRDWTRERVAGALQGARLVGSWYSEDGDVYHAALAMPLEADAAPGTLQVAED